MEFGLSDTQKQIQEMTRAFAEKEVRPLADASDKEARYPKEIVAKLAELGLMGMLVPESFGGAGLDPVSYALAIENISWGCASTGVIMSVNNSLYCDPIYKFGTEDQKRRWLVPFARGEKLGCFGLTEPASGSDASHMTTRAVKKGDRYILSGQKNFITNGPIADTMLTFAATDPGLGAKGITAFLVPRDAKGYIIDRSDKKLGIRASPCSTITFDDVELKDDHRLGDEGAGFKIAMSTLDGGRIGIAAQALGIARAAFDAARAWALERRAFGKPISEHQANQFKLADMAVQIEASRLLTLRAADMKRRGGRYTKEAAMAKLYASETAMRVATEAVQIFGGYGYVTDYPVERHFRDAKITQIYEGTSEIQRIVIASAVLHERT